VECWIKGGRQWKRARFEDAIIVNHDKCKVALRMVHEERPLDALALVSLIHDEILSLSLR
jgi:hypothetical protein